MNLQIYNLAHEAAVWRDMSHFGRFRCTGKDAATLLHHLTTNDIKGLMPGAGCDAALITSKARLLDWLTIYRVDDAFLVITSPNRRATFKPHVQKFILFRQEIKIEDVTDSTGMFGLFGPQLKEVATRFGAEEVLDVPLNRPLTIETNGLTLSAARTTRLPGSGVIFWSQDASGLRHLIQDSGQPLADDETYNVLRVEAGVPVAGLELTEEINPWEARFDEAISMNKGCYNGQEVVARLHTYKKVKQGLFGLKLEQSLPMGQRANLRCEERAAGFITSSVASPRFGPIALAYIRGDYQQPGQPLEVIAESATQKATVVELPFQNS
ncbi:MAG: aminomethyltransferase family protein [Abitibacteriaceae bacterium]|nr:aminomethyltransferase family protein [Abditibacteriaceae bacterium]